MTTATMIGIDLAKNVFQVHGTSMTGELKFRKKLSRIHFRSFMSGHPRAIVVMQACGSAHYWAREIAKYGHEVKLIAPQYVRPFVKRQKNDAADAEAIVIAAQRPEMRFITPKAEEQQARALLFRGRERLVRQRTEPALMIDALPKAKVLRPTGATMPIGFALPWPREVSPSASRQRPTARRRYPMTKCSTASATGSRTCSAGSRTGGVSIPATTDARTHSSPLSASQQPSSSGSDQ